VTNKFTHILTITIMFYYANSCMFRALIAHRQGVQYKNRFEVSENRGLRRISRPKGVEVPEGRKVLKNDVFRMCSLENITTCLNQREENGQTRNTSRLLEKCIQCRVGKPQEKKPFK
jgi:hypothetical protein